MELMEAIRGRRSIRLFHPAPVSTEIIRRILAAGKATPSAGNLQSRDFVVITDHSILERLVDSPGQDPSQASRAHIHPGAARRRKPSSTSVRFLAICFIQGPFGLDVQPAKCTRRVRNSMTKRR